MIANEVPLLRKRIREIGRGCSFDPEEHAYVRLSDGKRLLSSTGVTGKTQPKFDHNKWVLYKAAQATWHVKPKEIEVNGNPYWLVKPEMTVMAATHGARPSIKIPIYRDFDKAKEIPIFGKHVLRLEAEWEQKGIVGRDRGTQGHLYGEHLWMGRPRRAAQLVRQYPQYLDTFQTVERFWREWKGKLFPIAVECRVFSNVWPVAGTFDMLAFDRRGRIVLVDYKTDREVSTSKYDDCNPPLDYLPAGTLTKYSLQLGLYATLLLEHGIKVDDFLIVHLKSHRTNVPGDYELHNQLVASYKDVLKMLEAFSEN